MADQTQQNKQHTKQYTKPQLVEVGKVLDTTLATFGALYDFSRSYMG